MHTDLKEQQEFQQKKDQYDEKETENKMDESNLHQQRESKQVQYVIQRGWKANGDIYTADKATIKSFFQEQSSSQVQKQLFKRTYSFYQQNTIEPIMSQKEETVSKYLNIQDQGEVNQKFNQSGGETQQLKIIEKGEQKDVSQQVQTNKYYKYLSSAKECLQVLKLGYYFSALRVLFIFLIFYQFDFIIPKYPKKEDNKQIYEPWNVLVYLISGCIQFIAMIGFISSMRILKSDIKVLGKKYDKEEIKIKRQKYLLEIKRKRQYKYSKEDQEFMNELNMTEAHVVEAQDLHDRNVNLHQNREQRQRILRQGNRLYMRKKSTYRSVYNAILQFKYKDKEQSNPFKICKWIHIFGTFLFFGRFALIQFFSINREWKKISEENPNTEREVVLWIFLLTAYLSSFQIDLRNIQGSSGPYIKIKRFFTSKIYKIYCQFFRWRRHYSIILKVGIITASLCLICDFLIPHIRGNKQICSSVLIFKILLIITSAVNLIYNKNTILNAKQYIQNVPQCSMNNLQMADHKNLSILGVFHKNSHISYTYFLSFHRIILFLFGLALLKISDQEGEMFLVFLINIIVFIVYVFAESKKFYVFNDSQVNLFDVWKFKDFCNISQNSELAILDDNKQNEIKVSQQLMKGPIKNSTLNGNCNNQIFYNNCCSICLQQYEAQQNIIIVCCGHIFHQPCLMLWIKTKKQCAFCRFNLDDFYQDVSF